MTPFAGKFAKAVLGRHFVIVCGYSRVDLCVRRLGEVFAEGGLGGGSYRDERGAADISETEESSRCWAALVAL
ncbi:MAG: hypothetical protein RR842_12470, partial [Gordonibacter sp.]|uniref:hypothetical protein n=1 Tax=Gordonibacter sp. TaxID=1968902 RepID=UPI002FC94FAE